MIWLLGTICINTRDSMQDGNSDHFPYPQKLYLYNVQHMYYNSQISDIFKRKTVVQKKKPEHLQSLI